MIMIYRKEESKWAHKASPYQQNSNPWPNHVVGSTISSANHPSTRKMNSGYETIMAENGRKCKKKLHQSKSYDFHEFEAVIYCSLCIVVHDKTNKMMCAQQRLRSACAFTQSDQNLAVRLKKPRVLNYLLSAQRRLIRLGGCPGWSESSLGAHVILFVLSCCGSNVLIH